MIDDSVSHPGPHGHARPPRLPPPVPHSSGLPPPPRSGLPCGSGRGSGGWDRGGTAVLRLALGEAAILRSRFGLGVGTPNYPPPPPSRRRSLARPRPPRRPSPISSTPSSPSSATRDGHGVHTAARAPLLPTTEGAWRWHRHELGVSAASLATCVSLALGGRPWSRSRVVCVALRLRRTLHLSESPPVYPDCLTCREEKS